MTPPQETTIIQPALLPCPFCGREDLVTQVTPAEFGVRNHWAITCRRCIGRPAMAHDTREDARSAWNTRSQPAARSRRTMMDPQRMLWRDDVEGICPSPDICFADGCDHVRCGPCAIKQAAACGVETDHSVPNLPEVYRLRREIKNFREALERCAEIVERNLYRQHEKIEDVPRIARAAISTLTPARAEGFKAGIQAAAKVADENRTDDDSMWDRAASTISTAIRALKESDR